ncbi:nodulation protein NfeD [Chloroflexota bacterium]
MYKIARIFLLLMMVMVAAVAFVGVEADSTTPEIHVLHVEGTIVPAVSSYIDRGLDHAETRRANAVIIVLDTPGGLLSTTEIIVDRILDARVPVVVYVDKWAGSAGTFITLAAHVAAMAPGSRIGAASVVSGTGEDIGETLARKVTEDAAARVRSLADLRGRNQMAAMATVTEALSFTDQEALGIGPITAAHQELLELDDPYLDPPLVDLGAANLDSLIVQLDGMVVDVGGEQVTIVTEGYFTKDTGMTFIERFLHAISDPTIAYILLSLGTTAITLELFNPGSIFPGVVGAISLVLAFYSLSVLEAYWAGVLFIGLGFVMFIAEALTTTFGVLTVGGVASLVMGALILFGKGAEVTGLQINWWVVGVVIAVITVVFVFVVGAVVRAHRRRVTTGKEGLVGETAFAQTRLDPTGMVLVEGERWTARVEGGKIEPGEEVVVTRIDGLKLWVRKK